MHNPDGVQCIHSASREMSAARIQMMKAHNRLNDYRAAELCGRTSIGAADEIHRIETFDDTSEGLAGHRVYCTHLCGPQWAALPSSSDGCRPCAGLLTSRVAPKDRNP